eukprot:1161625-Pelagomonas_calceolata.AAC.6
MCLAELLWAMRQPCCSAGSSGTLVPEVLLSIVCTCFAELVRAVKQPGSSVEGGARWILQDVVGSEDGLGVECLSGSGAIASAFNRVFSLPKETGLQSNRADTFGS